MRNRPFPRLSLQICGAIVGVALLLGFLMLTIFQRQSRLYSSRLMETFQISPGSLHAMFVEDVQFEFWIAAALALALALTIAIVLSRLIVRPINQLADKAAEVAAGNLKARTPPMRGELGRVSQDFNKMVSSLEHEDQTRRQFIADLSHEIRTPLTTLKGYVEGLEDGVFYADANTLGILKDELAHLTSLASAIDGAIKPENSLQLVEVSDVSAQVLDAINRWHSPLARNGLQLIQQIESNLKARISSIHMRQILDNLFSNALSYATDAEPIDIRLTKTGNDMILTMSNASKGLNAKDCHHLFDRFYRADKSRSRSRSNKENARPNHQSTHRGLGLAIVKNLMQNAGGDAKAELVAGRLTLTLVLRA